MCQEARRSIFESLCLCGKKLSPSRHQGRLADDEVSSIGHFDLKPGGWEGGLACSSYRLSSSIAHSSADTSSTILRSSLRNSLPCFSSFCSRRLRSSPCSILLLSRFPVPWFSPVSLCSALPVSSNPGSSFLLHVTDRSMASRLTGPHFVLFLSSSGQRWWC